MKEFPYARSLVWRRVELNYFAEDAAVCLGTRFRRRDPACGPARGIVFTVAVTQAAFWRAWLEVA